MNVLLDVQLLGRLLIALGVAQLVPALAAALFGEPVLPYAASAIAAAVFGASFSYGSRPGDRRLRERDGFVLVVGAWLLASAFGALPYLTTGFLSPSNALFEAVAGFTTTASSAMRSLEDAPRALLLWRAMTQWIGGLGIVLVAVFLFPLFGIGGMQIFTSELGGTAAEAGGLRFTGSARRLAALYAGLSAAAFAALLAAGMGAFDALCHAFTGVATGGFSTRQDSVGAFGSAAVEWVVIVIMLLGATSFVVYYRLLARDGRDVMRDPELRCFVGIALSASVAMVWLLGLEEPGRGRSAVFQTVSLLTGTGYRTADFSTWGTLPQLLLLLLVIFGGMTRSTSGGIKSLRLVLGFRALATALTRLLHPHAIRRVKYAGRPVADEVLAGVWTFLTAYFLVVAAGAALVAAAGYDLMTAISAAFSAASNAGPTLGELGPGADFADFPGTVKLGLCVCMLAGRLEVFALFALVHPRFWQR
ncbi:MAG: TrkH family potassium uptake protein [Myxococcota bacterium]